MVECLVLCNAFQQNDQSDNCQDALLEDGSLTFHTIPDGLGQLHEQIQSRPHIPLRFHSVDFGTNLIALEDFSFVLQYIKLLNNCRVSLICLVTLMNNCSSISSPMG